MNTLAMVQARDRASQSLRDQQEKASALEHRLEVVRDVMQVRVRVRARVRVGVRVSEVVRDVMQVSRTLTLALALALTLTLTLTLTHTRTRTRALTITRAPSPAPYAEVPLGARGDDGGHGAARARDRRAGGRRRLSGAAGTISTTNSYH